MRRPPQSSCYRHGFTLVEVLIVVVILGILAATILPQFVGTTEDAKESALKQNLQQFRSQIELYRFQHNGAVPAAGLTTADDFRKALLCTSDADGTTDGTIDPVVLGTKAFGPYMLGQLPPNPYNGKNTVAIVTTGVLPADGQDGWSYNSTTGEIRANLPPAMTARDGVTALNSF